VLIARTVILRNYFTKVNLKFNQEWFEDIYPVITFHLLGNLNNVRTRDLNTYNYRSLSRSFNLLLTVSYHQLNEVSEQIICFRKQLSNYICTSIINYSNWLNVSLHRREHNSWYKFTGVYDRRQESAHVCIHDKSTIHHILWNHY
jgi:hypothetical protein